MKSLAWPVLVLALAGSFVPCVAQVNAPPEDAAQWLSYAEREGTAADLEEFVGGNTVALAVILAVVVIAAVVIIVWLIIPWK